MSLLNKIPHKSRRRRTSPSTQRAAAGVWLVIRIILLLAALVFALIQSRAQETTPEPLPPTATLAPTVTAPPLPTETAAYTPVPSVPPTLEATPEVTAPAAPTLTQTATESPPATPTETPAATAEVPATATAAPVILPTATLPTQRTAGGTTIHPEPVLPAGQSRVIVQLVVGPRGAVTPGTGGTSPAAADIAAVRGQVLAALAGHSIALNHAYDFIPFVALTVDDAGLAALRALPQVASVMPDELNFPALTSSTVLIGAQDNVNGDGAWDQGFDGSGIAVAVLDDGIDSNHPMFTGKIITAAEACFSSGQAGEMPGGGDTSNCPNGGLSQIGPGASSNSRCVTNFAGTTETCSHGTHVAGIAVGDNSAGLQGVAKGAQLVMVNVFSRFNDCSSQAGQQPCLSAWDSDILAALNYIYTLQQSGDLGVPIASVNLSLGGSTRYSSTCDASKSAYVSAFANLRSVGVAPVVAAGNNGDPYGISAPACVSNAVSVGSVDNTTTTNPDGISSFSNAASYLTLLAPGGSIRSSVYDNAYAWYNGTSMAAPHVAGAFAVLRQAAPQVSVDWLVNALRSTGTFKTDVSGYRFPRINLNLALNWGLMDVTFAAPNDPDDSGVMPVLTFDPARGGATHYRILAAPAGTSPATYDRWFTVNNTLSGLYYANCSGLCTIHLDRPLTTRTGTHDVSWWIQPYNNTTYGSGPTYGPLTYTAPAISLNSASPSGTVAQNDGLPQYTWPAKDGTEYYQLSVWKVTSPSWTSVVDQWIPAAAANCAATCSYTPSVPLYDGPYAWYVRAYDSAGGYSPWSASRSFTLDAAAPSTPVGLAPNATTVNTNTVDFGWTAQPGATWYELVVNNPSGTAIHRAWYTAADLPRSGDTLSKAVTVSGYGTYQWAVRAYGPGGYSGGYGTAAVTISSVAPPPTVTTDAAQAATHRGQITYGWAHNARNSHYELRVYTPGYARLVYSSTITAAQADCATVCTYMPLNLSLSNGSYLALVRGWGSAGYTQGGTNGGWSDATAFSLALAAPNANDFVQGSMGVFDAAADTGADNETLARDDSPNFRITDIPGASWYRVVVDNSRAVRVYDRWFQRSLQACAGGLCDLSETGFYPSNGTYTWWVTAWGPGGSAVNGTSGWRGPLTFTHANAIVTSSVVGAITVTGANTNRPTFSWAGLDDTSWYQVSAAKRANPAVACESGGGCTTVLSGAMTRYLDGCFAGDGAAPCTFTPTADLLDGTYQVYVRAWNGSGYSPWSAPTTFTLDVPDPGLAGLGTPANDGLVTSNQVDFTWTAGSGTTYHYLEVRNSSDAVVYTAWFTRAQSACAGADTACAVTGVSLNGGLYSYRLYSYNLGINPANVNAVWTALRYFFVLE